MRKTFDYATQRDDENVEVRFADGSRYDVPSAEWWAIVDAAHAGLLRGHPECECDEPACQWCEIHGDTGRCECRDEDGERDCPIHTRTES